MMGFFRTRHEYLYRCFIGVYHVVGKYLFAQSLDQQLQLHAAGTDPLVQGLARDGKASPAKDLFLTVQRQMITVLGDHHLS